MQADNTWTLCKDQALGEGRNGSVIQMAGPTMGVLKEVGWAHEADTEAALMKELHQ